MPHRALLPLLLLAACGSEATAPPPPEPKPEGRVAKTPPAPPPPRLPPAPPTDRAPAAEGSIDDKGAHGAAQVVQRYYALIESGDYEAAWRLREGGAPLDAFVASFASYADYRANVGVPSEMQGAAGSSYVEVPVQTYGRMKNGKPFSTAGTITLRRVNDVPGSTADQRRWRIHVSD